MKLGSSRSRERQKRRRRIIGLLLKTVFIGGVAFAIGGYIWQTASEVMRKEVETLTTRNSELQTNLDTLKDELSKHQAAHTDLTKKLPAPEEQAILDSARVKIGQGVSAKRLAEVVSAATMIRNCDNAPMTKRLSVRTPVAGSSSTAATFADNTITITAEGAPASNTNGQPEAWYDSKKPITISFMHLNGASSRAQGIVPLNHAIAVAGYEYRFQVQEGPRGMIVVTMDRCKP